MKIYTCTGDDGTTGLIGGTRVKKYNLRLEAYGTVDELNSYIGVIRSMQSDEPTEAALESIQNKLFVIGANLATEEKDDLVRKQLPCQKNDIIFLEKEIDRMTEKLPELRNFVLPGGSQVAGFCHVARTVCRRAERRIVELSEKNQIDGNLIKYINRLSDYLFVLSRKLNQDLKTPEKLWKPELNE
jgi:cob(I)alamin adenosyltransferase